MTAATPQPDNIAETALLGAILADYARVMPAVNAAGITTSDFYSPDNRRLFSAMLEMYAAGAPIDTLTVSRKTGMEVIALDAIMQSCPTTTHAQHYIVQVQAGAQRRHLAEIGTELQQAATDDRDPADIAASIRARLDAIQGANNNVFPPIHWHDLKDYEPPADHTIAGAGILRRSDGTLLTAGTGQGKSVLAMQICVDVAAGIPILGCIRVSNPMRVMLIEPENDKITLKRDLSAIIANDPGHPDPGLVDNNLRIFHVFNMPPDNLAAFIRQEARRFRPDLLAIDPYQAFMPPGTDLNNSASFLSFVQPIQKLIAELNCALLLIAHTPKPRDREAWTARESVYMAAGTSAISNWARASMELTQAGDLDGKYRLRFGKNAERNGLTTEGGGIVRDLYIEHSGSSKAPWWKLSDSQEPPAPISAKGHEIMRLAIEEPGLSYREIAERVGCSKATVATWYPKNKED